MKQDNSSKYTWEKLNKMSPEQLRRTVLLMQGQQKEIVEKQEEDLKKLQSKHDRLQAETDAMTQQYQLLQEKYAELEFMYAMVSDKLSAMERRRFGASSERFADNSEQLSIFNEAEAECDPDQEEPEYEEILPKKYRRKKRKGKKEEDLSRFPVTRTIKNKLSGEERLCPECGTKMNVVTTEIRKFLEFIPAHFEVVEEITYVYSCPKCSTMKRAPKENALLKGSLATASLVSGVMNAKFVQGMPLDRQSREFIRYDLNLSTKTLSNWMILCAERYLRLLYDAMKQAFLKCRYIHCDETRIQVLDEPDQKPETQNWMWVYMTGRFQDGPHMVLFDYERTRGGYHPVEFLKGIGECYLTCDGYQPYHNLPEHITVTGCLAHSRRRFEEALKILKKEFKKEELKKTTAHQAMTRIQMLYKIEELTKEISPEERYQERQKQAKPLLEAFFQWLHSLENKVNRSTQIGKAVNYALNQEEYLKRYLDDGHLPIDNNDCERRLKNFAIGRRGWLFAKSIRGAEASAVIYSITETALMNGLKPYNYLTYVLDEMRKLPAFPSEESIQSLLPWSPTLPEICRTQIDINNPD